VKALVTGGAGFIGSTLVDRLMAEGHDVDVVDDLSSGSLDNLADARAGAVDSRRDQGPQLSIHHLDVRHPSVTDLVERRRPDVIFHLAVPDPGAGEADPVADAEATVVAGLRVLEAARTAGTAKVVVALDAGAVHGPPLPEDLPMREAAPVAPGSVHGVASRALLGYLSSFRERHAVEFTALAMSTLYGPRARRGLVHDLVRAAVTGGPAIAEGGPSRTVDLVYVDDAVDALVRAARRGSGLLVNVGSGTETSLAAVLGSASVAAGTVTAPLVEAPLPVGVGARACLDRGRASIHLGWRPWTSLADGLAATLAWHRRSAPS